MIGKTAQLEFYDFEADLTGPSIDGRAASRSRRGRCTTSCAGRRRRRTRERRRVVPLRARRSSSIAGPAPTKAVPAADPASRSAAAAVLGKMPKGWKMLASRPTRSSSRCDSRAGLSRASPAPTRGRRYYLFKHDRQTRDKPIPEMTGAELKSSGTRAGLRSQTASRSCSCSSRARAADVPRRSPATSRARQRSCAGARRPGHARSTSRSCSTARSSPCRTIDYGAVPDGIAGGQRRADHRHRPGRGGEGPRDRPPDRRAAGQVRAARAHRRLGDARQGLADEAKNAALVGLLVVALFLLLVYRFLGLVAVIGLGDLRRASSTR